MPKKKRIYHDITQSDPQLVLAMLIVKDGSWGAYDSKSKTATKAEVIKFFDKVIAICAAESSFRADARNGSHVGLFQINEKLHADKIKGRDLTDPLVNVQVAAAISKEAFERGKDMFSPWQAYNLKTPAYLANRGWGADAYDYAQLMNEISLGEATAKAAAVFANPLLANNATGAVVETIGNLDSVGKVLEFIRKSGTVIGAFALGLILLIAGIWILFGRQAIEKATDIVPAKKIVKDLVK